MDGGTEDCGRVEDCYEWMGEEAEWARGAGTRVAGAGEGAEATSGAVEGPDEVASTVVWNARFDDTSSCICIFLQR